jgi:hypothetical protein
MKRISRCLLGLVTCVVPVFIAACYGVMNTFSQRGQVVDKNTKAAVAGLRVECLNASSTVTDMTHSAWDGTFALHTESASSCTTIAVDDDRETGARYASTTALPDPGKDLVIEVAPLP